jgi:hypothetical protein
MRLSKLSICRTMVWTIPVHNPLCRTIIHTNKTMTKLCHCGGRFGGLLPHFCYSVYCRWPDNIHRYKEFVLANRQLGDEGSLFLHKVSVTQLYCRSSTLAIIVFIHGIRALLDAVKVTVASPILILVKTYWKRRSWHSS